MTNDEMKKTIDESSYEDLLCRWRTAPVGSPFFMGDIGNYYFKIMAEKKAKLSHGEQVQASKNIGW